MSIGNFPEDLSQAILVGIILVGRLGVSAPLPIVTIITIIIIAIVVIIMNMIVAIVINLAIRGRDCAHELPVHVDLRRDVDELEAV